MQIDILGCLALRGKLTKGMTESLLPDKRHGDILDSFGKLEKNKFIKKLKEQKFGRGRAQFYYKITEDGLGLLINYEPVHPSKFWKAMFGYCYHNNGNISSDRFEELYKIFIKQYIRYPDHGFTFQLDVFTEMRDNWLKDFIINNDNDKISAAQKVIEILAIYPKLTLEELVERTQEDEDKISKVLLMYTIEAYNPIDDKTYYMHQGITGGKYNKKYQDFLLHCAITVRQNNEDVKTYELSVFGIMLTLTLVRYYDMNKLMHGLYYRDISFPRYYDKIASNYKDKLPLIFGKWRLLKNILELFSAYNFDIVLDKDLRVRDDDKVSVVRGGNKELLDSIREIVFQTRQQIADFAMAGRSIWPEHIPGMPYVMKIQETNDGDYLMRNKLALNFEDGSDLSRVDIIRKKLVEIMILLNPLEYGFSELVSLSQEKISEISYRFEELFIDEITALYYIHLYYDYGFDTRINKPANYRYSSSVNRENKFPMLLPKACLDLILKKDKKQPLISEWYNVWKRDISNLQREIYEILKLQR